jgi:hypothetical protein
VCTQQSAEELSTADSHDRVRIKGELDHVFEWGILGRANRKRENAIDMTGLALQDLLGAGSDPRRAGMGQTDDKKDVD